jgi:DNA-binding CsgD family transcriptional regulator
MKLQFDNDILDRAFDLLSTREKEAWLLLKEGLSQSEIARKMGISRTRVYQMRNNMKYRIGAAHREDRIISLATHSHRSDTFSRG